MTLAQIIARVQVATGPDRELDALIDAAIHGGRASHTFSENDSASRLRRSYGPGTVFDHTDQNTNGGNVLIGMVRNAPKYTEYFDAALTLVPAGHGWYVRENCSSDGDEIYCNAQVWPYANPRDDEASHYWANTSKGLPALALTAACLKARAAA